MPSGPGIIDDKLIYEIARMVPPPISTFLLTSETQAEDIAANLILVIVLSFIGCRQNSTNTSVVPVKSELIIQQPIDSILKLEFSETLHRQ